MGRTIKVQRSTLEKKIIMKSSKDTVEQHMSSAFNELMSSEISGALDWLGSTGKTREKDQFKKCVHNLGL